MTDRRTIGPDREPPPYVTQHALAAPSKLEPPRETGDEPEALHGSSHKSRVTRARKAIRTLELFIVCDLALEARVRLAGKTPYPPGGAEGSRSSGVSDPTYKAAQWGHIKDPAERGYDSFDDLTKAAWWLGQHIKGAARMNRSETKEAKEEFTAALNLLLNREEQQAAAAEQAVRWCPSCAKVGLDIERGTDKEVGKDCDDCGWCHWFKRTYNREVPRVLLRLRKKRFDEGQQRPRVYEHEIVQALQPQKAHG